MNYSFQNYFERYKRLYSLDLKIKNPTDREILTYMFASMSEIERERYDEQKQRSLEILTSDAIWAKYIFNIDFRNLKYLKIDKKNSILHDLKIKDPFFLPCMKYGTTLDRIENKLQKESEEILVKSLIKHEILHYLIGADFRVTGDRYVAVISQVLGMDNIKNQHRWDDYVNAIFKTKFTTLLIKNNLSQYKKVIQKNTQKTINFLNDACEQVFKGTYISPKEIYSRGDELGIHIPNSEMPQLQN